MVKIEYNKVCDKGDIFLPFPPTVNKLYSGKQRRYCSDAYKSWKILAGSKLKQSPGRKIYYGKVKVTYEFRRPDNRIRDVFNYEKALTDLLVEYGVIRDDSLIMEGTVKWSESKDFDGVKISIREV